MANGIWFRHLFHALWTLHCFCCVHGCGQEYITPQSVQLHYGCCPDRISSWRHFDDAMRTVHWLSDESGTCGWPKPIDPVQIIAKKSVWCVDTRTHVVNHWCKEHCVINNDVNLKFCRDSRVCGSCALCTAVHAQAQYGVVRCDLCNSLRIVQIRDKFAFLQETHVDPRVVPRFGTRNQEKSFESAWARYSTFRQFERERGWKGVLACPVSCLSASNLLELLLAVWRLISPVIASLCLACSRVQHSS